MAKMIDKKPDYKGEAKVWEKINEYLPKDVVVYNQREINGREYDFCLMIENVGILIIEVKGWLANKIDVRGVDEIIVEGYDNPQSSPKKQARAYHFALLNKISEKYNVSPLVLDMVCYPFYGRDKGKPRKSKKLNQVASGDERPHWFDYGVEMALLAPTAINQQKFEIIYDAGDVVFKDKGGMFSKIDLGIVKYHFEVGAIEAKG